MVGRLVRQSRFWSLVVFSGLCLAAAIIILYRPGLPPELPTARAQGGSTTDTPTPTQGAAKIAGYPLTRCGNAGYDDPPFVGGCNACLTPGTSPSADGPSAPGGSPGSCGSCQVGANGTTYGTVGGGGGFMNNGPGGGGSGGSGDNGGGSCPGPSTQLSIPGASTPPGMISDTASVIDNFTFNYIHWGDDLRATSSNPWMTAQLRRYYRSRDVAHHGSFGPGWFSNYDIHLRLEHIESEYDWSTLADEVILFDATSFYPRRLVRDTGFTYVNDGQVPLGTVHLLQSDGSPATLFGNAAFAELRQPTGGLFRFELYAEESQHLDEMMTMWIGNARLLGRLVRMQDSAGYGTTLTYQEWDPEDLEESPERFYQIDQVTGDDGTSLTFTYLGTQVGGRWAVESVEASSGGTVTYDYDAGWLSTVTLPDEAVSTFTYDYSATSHTDVVTFEDAASQGTHRKKTVHFSVLVPYGTAYLLGAGGRLTRMVVSADNEVTYLNMVDIEYTPSNGEVTHGFVYLGSGKLLRVDEYSAVSAYKDGWYFDLNSTATNGFLVEGETDSGTTHTYADYVNYQWYPSGRPYEVTNDQGLTQSHNYNSAGWLTRTNYADSTYETYCYNSRQQVTRYRDRLGRVTKYIYNSQGNMLTKAVGLVEAESNTDPCATNDVETDEYAVYEWEYYPAEHAHQYLLSAAIDPNGHQTDYTYDANHRLSTITDPPDVAEGDRAVTTFTYTAAGHLATVTDALDRVTEFFYDANGRRNRVLYDDGSEERFIYGTGDEANLVLKVRDRRGVVTAYEYDDAGRRTKTIYAAATMDLTGAETAITDPALRQEEVVTYLTGTNLPATVTRAGDLTEYDYDFRHRLVATTVHPNTETSLTSGRTYVNNQLFSTEDPYGRKTFYAYDATDGRLIRTIVGTVPSVTYAAFSNVLAAERDEDGTPNSTSIISDNVYDAEGQLTTSVDPRGIEHTTTYDSRGQRIRRIQAAGTAVAAKTEMDYDVEGQTVTIRHPRYFDEDDTNGFEAAKTTMTYTGRGLLASRTEAPGTAVAATESFTYDLVGRQASRVDFRGKTWLHQEPACCGRVIIDIDPLGHGTIAQTDAAGHVTHWAAVADVDDHTNTSNPIDGKTLSETTSKYDERGRIAARTVWLSARGTVDPTDPPIYDMSSVGMGTPDGLTTTWTYDDDLNDSAGLDDTFSDRLANLDLGSGSDGSAVLVTNPKGERVLTIKDGLGRTVRTVQLASNDTALTSNTSIYDATVTISGYGVVVETASKDALNHTNKRRTDAAGRTIQSVNAASFLTNYHYNASGKRLQVRDPNSVGEDCEYDALGRKIQCADTQEQSESKHCETSYDLAGNVLTQTDAKSHVATNVYDARGRRISQTDRISAETVWAYDAGGLELSMTDAESQTTSYEYDDRGARVKTTWPDHTAMSSPGDSGYGITEVAYDAAGRAIRKTDQFGDTLTFVFDLAGRMTTRQHRTRANSPSGTIASSDTFTYDWAGRILTAVSGLYSNTVTFTYDEGGRRASEALTAFGQTYAIGLVYDAAGRNSAITYPDSSVVHRNYTSRGQLEEVTYTPSGSMTAQTVNSRTYDDGGRLDEETHGNSLVTSWSYRDDNLPTAINNSTIGNLSYTYDANKNPTAESWSGVMADYSWTAGYDNQDRLTSWNRSNGDDQAWTLSAVGNWSSLTENSVTQSRTHGSAHELTAIGSSSLTYDAKGNLTHDQDGKVFTWDAYNMLTSADVPNGAPGIEGTHIYTYDALGRRVSKTVNDDIGMSSTTTVFVSRTQPISYSPYAGQEVAEYPSGTAASSPLRKHIFASYIDEPVVLIDCTASGGISAGTDELVYLHHSRLFNVVALTDSSAAVLERTAYTSYGKPTFLNPAATSIHATSTLNNPWSFTGRRTDSEAAHQYFRARIYAPNNGTFISRDFYAYHDSPSLYCALRNHPLRFLDASGFAANIGNGCDKEQEKCLLSVVDELQTFLKTNQKCFERNRPNKPGSKSRKATPGEQKCRDQLTDCLASYLDSMEINCDQNCKLGIGGGYASGPCSDSKDEARNNGCKPSDPCKGEEPADPGCGACPKDLLPGSSINMCVGNAGKSGPEGGSRGWAMPDPLVPGWCNQPVNRQILAGLLIHEMMHHCTGGHVYGGKTAGGKNDKCERPDAGDLQSDFARNCGTRFGLGGGANAR